MVIAATNRPEDIDPAVRRRFERSFLVALPDEAARSEIFKKVLASTSTDGDIDYAYCARGTEGFCSSDIVAVCKAAMAIPVHERRAALRRSALSASQTNTTTVGDQLRPLTMADIEATLKGFHPTSRLPRSSSGVRFGSSSSGLDGLNPESKTGGSSSSPSSSSPHPGGFGMTNRPFQSSGQFDDGFEPEESDSVDDEDDEEL